jgi:DNA-binding Lrp family transcriptional regulator
MTIGALGEMLDERLSFRLLNEFQRDFPLCPAPFAELASRLEAGEGVVLRTLEALRRAGKVARVGAVFSPKRIGASTLAAMAVPSDKLALVADAVNRFPEVNHNYEREHHYNLWFVVTAGSQERLQAVLDAIGRAAGFPVLALPMVHEFHIDLGFPLDGSQPERTATVRRQTFVPPTPLAETDRRLVVALQEGLPLFIRPFSVLASRVGCDESEVIERIRRWCAEGIIKRFGVIVRHHELGYTANAMLVHDVPDAAVVEVGERLAQAPGVTLCYQRPRVQPHWPYNLFCMIHGQARSEVEARIADLRARLQLAAYAHDVLFSLTRFKQGGARYA